MTSVGVVNMEEREALKRQIELLQNLINKHKRIHGDAPFPGNEPTPAEPATLGRDRGPSVSAGRPHGSQGGAFTLQGHGSWKKTYSLKNKAPPSSTSSSSSSSAVHQPAGHSVALPVRSRGPQGDGVDASDSGIVQDEAGPAKECSVVSERGDGKQAPPEGTTQLLQHKQSQELHRHPVLPGHKVPPFVKASSSIGSQSSSRVLIRPLLTSRTSAATHTVTGAGVAAGHITPALTRISQTQGGNASSKKSKFTWVKSPNTVSAESNHAATAYTSCSVTANASTAPASVPTLGALAASASPSPASRRIASKKSLRKLSPLTAAPKVSKYKWVSSGGPQPRPARKSPSPRTPSPSTSAALSVWEKADAARKLKTTTAASPKLKKGAAGPSASRYRWKASTPSGSPVVSGAAAARRRSAFHWTAEKSNKGAKGGLQASLVSPQRVSVPSSSPGAFKLRSRMKIIRRSPGSGGSSEKGVAASALRISPRGRSHVLTRSPWGVRRTPGRDLVSFGKHKLRRLPPNVARTSPASPSSLHHRPAFQRVFRSRYKMVTHPGSGTTTLHALHYNPALSWRAKRIQSARSFLQSRLRAPDHQHRPPHARWRGSSMCWIRGSLYRVSANKLSRTTSASLSINRTGRSPGLPTSPLSPRPFSPRHLASRAVQRSLAIIRLARQRKQPKQFCMYYNRFGRCNRGAACPFIHDPDKVAVCTRFLRGTCKRADTCPFSHKVAKEKMPVCSYFLKGICNHSDCPYSHVYVSRKAKVCEDFVRGYCPEGEKCKKKHTLVCPDFSQPGSCPRGSRCKLLHRQRIKRGGDSSSATKRVRREPVKRADVPVRTAPEPPAAPGAPGTHRRSALALPSFISLSSSSEEADPPDTLPPDTSHFREKKLQIKPRL